MGYIAAGAWLGCFLTIALFEETPGRWQSSVTAFTTALALWLFERQMNRRHR